MPAVESGGGASGSGLRSALLEDMRHNDSRKFDNLQLHMRKFVNKKALDFHSHLNYNKGVNESEVKHMSPRTGRPKVENAKIEKMSICLDHTTKQKLENYCKQENVSRSEAIRRGINLLTETK